MAGDDQDFINFTHCHYPGQTRITQQVNVTSYTVTLQGLETHKTMFYSNSTPTLPTLYFFVPPATTPSADLAINLQLPLTGTYKKRKKTDQYLYTHSKCKKKCHT